MQSISLGVAKVGNLKLDFKTKSIRNHFLGFEDIFRFYGDIKTLKNLFGCIDTLIFLTNFSKSTTTTTGVYIYHENIKDN